MVSCDKCHVEMNYLPFRCKYCGRTFCRDHRLPEKHECTGGYSAPIVVPARIQEQMGIEIEPGKKRPQERPLYQGPADDSEPYRKPKIRGIKNRRSVSRTMRSMRPATGFWKYPATYTIMILILVGFVLSLFSVTALFVEIFPYTIFRMYFFWTLITAVFVPDVGLSFFGFLFLIIIELVFWSFGRPLEMRFGARFLVTFVIVCGFLTGAVYILTVGLFSFIPVYASILDSLAGFGTTFSVIIGFLIFLAYQAPQQKIYIMPIPVPIKVKTAAIIFLAIGMGLSFLYWAITGSILFACQGLSYVGTILAGYLLAKHSRFTPPSRPPPLQFIAQ